jgi:hypothetical protein
MHRPETNIAKEVKILCNKKKPLSQVHENQCIGLIGEYSETIISTSSDIYGVTTELRFYYRNPRTIYQIILIFPVSC